MPSRHAAEEPAARRALVTGSSSGIGMAIAGRLLDDGWQVAGFDVAPPQLAHRSFVATTVDLTDPAATAAAARGVIGAGAVDAFVHAAGVLRVGTLGALRADDGALMWRLHVDAATVIANVVIPAMTAAGRGRVVLVGSRVAQGVAGRSQYAATKAALIALARSWAAESVAGGVTVNVVSPAATQTAMLDDPARRSEAPRVPPLGRLIRPGEIAALTAFLLSADAAAITGQDIQICGGSSLFR
jgi:NAD(P)-dependent dehydrogenase (short-subunit alcohol dehydrogenase family)